MSIVAKEAAHGSPLACIHPNRPPRLLRYKTFTTLGGERRRRYRCRSESTEGSPFVKACVSIATSVLSAVSPKCASLSKTSTLRRFCLQRHCLTHTVNRTQESSSITPSPQNIADFRKRLAADYQHRQYFVSGDLDLGLYSSNCLFADPTISFRGRSRYQKNLRNLKSFFLKPFIELFSLQQTSQEPIIFQVINIYITNLTLSAQRYAAHFSRDWKTALSIVLHCFWIVSHVERWNVSAKEAIQQIFTL